MAEIIKVEGEKFFGPDEFTINWPLHRKCNFKCSYCYARDRDDFVPEFGQTLKAVKLIHGLPHARINIVLTGGEPTIYPQFRELAVALTSDPRVRLIVQTNLSLPLDLAEPLPTAGVEFLGSLHFDHFTAPDFIAKAQVLNEMGFPVALLVIAHPRHMDTVRQVYEALPEMVELIRVVQWRGKEKGKPDKRYKWADLVWLNSVKIIKEPFLGYINLTFDDGRQERTTTHQMLAKGQNRFKGMICAAGLNLASISQRGKIDRAVCFRSGKKAQGGNAFEGGSLHFEGPVICPRPTCNCGNDLGVPKWKK
jgi:organic radical activating enzyme